MSMPTITSIAVAHRWGRLNAAVDAAWEKLDAAQDRGVPEDIELALEHYLMAVETWEEFEEKIRNGEGVRPCKRRESSG